MFQPTLPSKWAISRKLIATRPKYHGLQKIPCLEFGLESTSACLSRYKSIGRTLTDEKHSIGHSFKDADIEKFTPKLIARYKSLVETLYRDGGRKFLFINVPPTTRTPEYSEKSEADKKKHAKYLSYFNDKLEDMVNDVAKQDGVRYSFPQLLSL